MADTTQINEHLNPSGSATVLNPELGGGRQEVQNGATVLNPALAQGQDNATVLNPSLTNRGAIAPGTVLWEQYRVTEKMPVTAGEADLYLCEYENRRYVAKVYRRTVAVKEEVLRQLKTLSSPYVAGVCHSGEFEGASVEILPYYSRGSLSGKTFTYEQLRDHIIPCLNEGLKALHDVNIIHKDLKPSNIMVAEDQQSVAIIDFGISSVTQPDHTVIVTQTGMTPEYSAPETFKGLYSDQADYYSLGITLYELFAGKTPYHNMSADDIEKYISIQRIPFPSDMPVRLQELIRALTYYDISNRRDKTNPNRRWGYEEVRNWLAGIKQTIPGEGVGRRDVKPYFFAGQNYTLRKDLIRAMVTHWDEGKKQLFRGKLSDYYRLHDYEAFQICQAAEAKAAKTSGKDDMIFWETLYRLDPSMKEFIWKGRFYAGLPAMGRDLMEHLRKNSNALDGFMEDVFRNDLMSRYVAVMEPDDQEIRSAVENLEIAHRGYVNSPRDRRVNLYLTAYLLSGQRVFSIAGQEFHNLDELVTYMKQLLGENNEHLDRFKSFCHLLMDHYDHLIPPLESWLIALGRGEELENWKQAMFGSQ